MSAHLSLVSSERAWDYVPGSYDHPLRALLEARGPRVIYTGVFLSNADSQALLHWWERGTGVPLLPNTYAHHMTIAFRPSMEQTLHLPMGSVVPLRVVGWVADERGQAVIVDAPPVLHVQNDMPHITVATAHGTKPFYSNQLLGSNPAQREMGPTLRGVVGYFDGRAIRTDTRDLVYESKEVSHTAAYAKLLENVSEPLEEGWWGLGGKRLPDGSEPLIGDTPADLLGGALEKVARVYEKHPEIKRPPTVSEMKALLKFVLGGASEKKRGHTYYNPHNIQIENLEQRRQARQSLLEFTNKALGVVPTQAEKDQVSEIVKQLPMKSVARDFGYVAGKYLSDVLEMAGMRPSDYVNLQDLSESFVGRFLAEMKSNEEIQQVFAKHFLEQISLRG